jgi:DNA polymerase-3 subunit delta'
MLSVLEDLLLIQSGAPKLVRNIDLEKELAALAAQVDLDWIEAVERGVQRVRSGMRRNLLRSLSLDAFATELVR